MLDFEEYLHLAIHASQNNAHHSALEYLHKALDLSADDARAVFLLAAEHAELGLYDRAISGMEKCLLLDSTIEMAYYQLGLLYLQMGRQDDSHKMWHSLSGSLDVSPLKYFADGMLIIDINYDQGLNLLNKAFSMQTGNTALQNSINTVIGLVSNDKKLNVSDSIQEEQTNNTLFLNVYKNSKFNDEN